MKIVTINKFFPLLLVIATTLIQWAFTTPSSNTFVKKNCEYRSANYSLEWAFEPTTETIVFLLKTAYDINKGDGPYFDGFWTGVGFGKENVSGENPIDFIGIFANTVQVGILDGHLDHNGVLLPDYEDNIKTISLKAAKDDGFITAKFARSITVDKSQEIEDADLSKCITFYIPVEAIKVSKKTKQSPVAFNWLKKVEVCNISESCRIETATKSNSSAREVPRSVENALETTKKKIVPEFAHSVDTGENSCFFSTPRYSVSWFFDKDTQRVNFVMRHQPKKGRWWSAVGIGDNMSDMDVGVLFLQDGRLQKIVDYYSDSYDVPLMDSHQDWTVDRENTRRVGDLVELHFSRAITTGDEKDKTMDGCIIFQFAANAGSYGQKFQIYKHDELPDTYKVCGIRTKCLRESNVAESIDEAATNSTETAEEKTKNSNITRSSEADKKEDQLILMLLQKRTNINRKLELSENNTSNIGVLPSTPITNDNNTFQSSPYPKINGTIQNLPNQWNYSKSPKQAEKKLEFEKPRRSGNDSQNSLERKNGITAEDKPTKNDKEVEDISAKKRSDAIIISDNGSQIDNTTKPQAPVSSTNSTSSNTSTSNSSTGNTPVLTVEINADTILNKLHFKNVNSTDNRKNSSTNENHSSSSVQEVTIKQDGKLPTTNSDKISTKTINGLEDAQKIVKRVENNSSLNENQQQKQNTENGNKETTASSNNNKISEKKVFEQVATNVTNPNNSTVNEKPAFVKAMEKRLEELKADNTQTTIGASEQTTTISQQSTTAATTSVSKNEQPTTIATSTEGGSTPATQQSTTTATTTQKVDISSSSQIAETSPLSHEKADSIAATNNSQNSGSNSSSSKTKEKVLLPILDGSGCDALKPDLDVCESYMNNYLNRVKEWADRHNEPMDKQYGKACKLLSAVPHVPTLCCQIFSEKCRNHI